ncbi:hypothetical protein EDD17DRAFT_1765874 [Pisolithus thermaeus]|nr:hypothetical protein EDD17DRAFT_1765874 [Pisolithus thermaeus]
MSDQTDPSALNPNLPAGETALMTPCAATVMQPPLNTAIPIPPTATASSASTSRPVMNNHIPIMNPATAEVSLSTIADMLHTPLAVSEGKRRERPSERERDSGGKIEKMEKLTDNNWLAWKKKIIAMLQALDLYDIIARLDPRPSENRPDELKDWQKWDKIVYTTLMTNLTNSQTMHAHLSEETSATL